MHYKVHERNGTPLDGMLVGLFYDWDLEPNSANNTRALVPDAAA